MANGMSQDRAAPIFGAGEDGANQGTCYIIYICIYISW